MQLTFIEARVPLTKTYAIDSDGNLVKSPYPHVSNLTSHEVDVTNIAQFHRALVKHSAMGHALLKGPLTHTLDNESRRNKTDRMAPTGWVCADNDGLDVPPEEFMTLLGLGNVDYIVQYSSSAHVDKAKRNHYHCFFLLDKPMLPAHLVLWLTAQNILIDTVRSAVTLTKNGNALKWPIDPSVGHNSKIIYIADPILEDGVRGELMDEPIRLVKGRRRTASLDLASLNETTLKLSKTALMNELRGTIGLPAKTPQMRTNAAGVEYMTNPDSTVVTGIRDEDDSPFVYLNLNGGDSFAYYHPKDDASYLFNFKGEPVYPVKKLCPEYFERANEIAKRIKVEKTREAKERMQAEAAEKSEVRQSEQRREAERKKGKVIIFFRDAATDQYYMGHYDYATSNHELITTKSRDRMYDWLVQHGEAEPAFIPTWRYEFDPTTDVTFDPDKKFLNKYQPTELLTEAKHARGKVTTFPPTIKKLIWHVCGEDQEVFDHLINWIACLIQYRTSLNTAWVLHGTTGTGKGTLIHRVLAPILGRAYVKTVNYVALSGEFNRFMGESILTLIDEADITSVPNAKQLVSKIKSWITEPVVPIRAMRTDHYEVANHNNFMFASNTAHAMLVEHSDRRITVCSRQDTQLPYDEMPQMLRQIDEELPAFTQYMLQYQADKRLAGVALMTQAKADAEESTVTAADSVSKMLRVGDFEDLVDLLPEPGRSFKEVEYGATNYQLSAELYRIVSDALEAMRSGSEHALVHKDLFFIFEAAVGKIPNTQKKLTTYLRHRLLHIERRRLDGERQRGIWVEWKCEDETFVKRIERQVEMALRRPKKVK